MKIVVPMAGMGKRMRPHTLITPKPLLPIAGKPIVQRLVEDIASVCAEQVEEIAFVIGRFGKEVEENLIAIADSLDAKGTIHYQDEALGTAHAIYCAESALNGNVVVAFADTLFKADFTLDQEKDGIIWVKQIEDPSAFGVVKVNEDNVITDFIEKPKDFVSDLAIIGIYYFKEGEILREEIKKLIDNNVMKSGEYQLTDALENMKSAGFKFSPGQVEEWLDCGNKNATVYTNQRILEFNKDMGLISATARQENSVIIPPCFFDDDVIIKNSVVGPHVSLEKGAVVENSIISNSIVRERSKITNAAMTNSMIGTDVVYERSLKDLSIGDYTTEKA